MVSSSGVRRGAEKLLHSFTGNRLGRMRASWLAMKSVSLLNATSVKPWLCRLMSGMLAEKKTGRITY